MKKILALLLALICTVGTLCGCKAEQWDGYENADLTKYVKLGQFRGLKYAKANASVTDEEVDDEIEALLSDHMYRSEITDRAAEKGDYCVLTYTTECDGKKVESLSGEEVSYAVGSVYTLPELKGVTDAVVGKKAGESFETDALIETEEEPDLNGKTAHVSVTVVSVFEYLIPELTDEIVPDLSETAKTVDEFCAEVRKELEEKAKADADYTDQETLWNLILDGAEMLKYPEAEVNRYASEMREYYEEYAAYYNYSLEEFLSAAYGTTTEEFEKSCIEYGQTSVKNDVVLYAVIRELGITVTDAEYQSALLRYFNESGEELGVESPEDFETYYTKTVIMQTLLFEKVIDAVKAEAIPA